MKNEFLYVSGVEYDYDTTYDCENYYCSDEGICRCSTIENARVIEVDLIILSEYFYDSLMNMSSISAKRDSSINDILYGGKNVDLYFINRILTTNKVYDTYNWEVETCGGYYGDELENISLSNFKKVISECNHLLSIDNISDKVKYILNIEYNEVLDSLKDKEFEIISINKSDINFDLSNQKHLELINNKDLSFYKDYPYYCGIVKKSGDKFKIIDGHHRLSTVKKRKIDVICVK